MKRVVFLLHGVGRHDEKWSGSFQTRFKALVKGLEKDGEFKPALDGYKYPQRQPDSDADAHRARGGLFLAQLEARLQATACLHGDRAALADAAIAPFVRQFAQVDAAWFDAQPWPKLRAWLSARLDAPVFTCVMEKYPKWRPGQPPLAHPHC